MVLKDQMKTFRIILIFLAFMLFFSCEEDEQTLQLFTIVDCNECTAEEPLKANIRIKLVDPLKFGYADERIFIDIYEGNLEDNVLFKSIQTSSNETSVSLPINKKYTFMAIYFINNKTYKTVNSITTRVKYNKSSCDEPCYYTMPRSVNLKLKYTK